MQSKYFQSLAETEPILKKMKHLKLLCRIVGCVPEKKTKSPIRVSLTKIVKYFGC